LKVNVALEDEMDIRRGSSKEGYHEGGRSGVKRPPAVAPNFYRGNPLRKERGEDSGGKKKESRESMEYGCSESEQPIEKTSR